MDEFLGEIVEVFFHKTQSGDTMYFLIVESDSDAIEVVLFPSVVKQCTSLLKKGKVIKAKGEFHTDNETDSKKLVAEIIEKVE